MDLFVVSGGNQFTAENKKYQDRLYKNDGKGNFTIDNSALPEMIASGSCQRAQHIQCGKSVRVCIPCYVDLAINHGNETYPDLLNNLLALLNQYIFFQMKRNDFSWLKSDTGFRARLTRPPAWPCHRLMRHPAWRLPAMATC